MPLKTEYSLFTSSKQEGSSFHNRGTRHVQLQLSRSPGGIRHKEKSTEKQLTQLLTSCDVGIHTW